MTEPVFHLAPVPAPSEPAGDGPGARLRAAREKLGLTIEEICAELKLAPDQVDDLERDRYDRIAAETYVRGYLRSYARVVKLPPEQVLEQYRTVRMFGESARPVSPRPASQASFPERPVKLVGILLLVVGAGIAIGTWYAAGGGSAPPAPLEQAGMPPQSPAAPAATTALRPDGNAHSPALTDGWTETAGSRRSPSPALPEVHPGDGSIAPSGPAADETAREPAPVARATPQAAPPDVVALAFEQTSWAEVQDATGRRLLYQTVEAGRELELSGLAPFAVVLGNATGVRVRFNGERVSVPAEEAGTVSRFNLGEEQALAE